MTSAVKTAKHHGQIPDVAATLLMIAKDLIPAMGTKSFAIMEDNQFYEVSGITGAAVIIYAVPEQRLS